MSYYAAFAILCAIISLALVTLVLRAIGAN